AQRSDRCWIDDGTVRVQVGLDVLSERESRESPLGCARCGGTFRGSATVEARVEPSPCFCLRRQEVGTGSLLIALTPAHLPTVLALANPTALLGGHYASPMRRLRRARVGQFTGGATGRDVVAALLKPCEQLGLPRPKHLGRQPEPWQVA